jgi:short-subunit dehydrogenase
VNLCGRHARRFSDKEMKLDGRNALITGASTGIGREFARQLAGRAQSLILVARREQRLNELRDGLTQKHPNLRIQVRETDLADFPQTEELTAWLEREHIDVDLLINNAGLGDSGPFATSDPRRNEQMMLVNMVALTSLARRLLPQMIARRRGGILNVSSSAGFLPIPNFAVYAATKAYVTSFSEALRTELHGTGVIVCALCPGPVHTEFQKVANRSGGRSDSGPEFVHVSVEQVVHDALAALEADRPLVIPGLAMKLAMFLVRITPMPILRWASRFSGKRV